MLVREWLDALRVSIDLDLATTPIREFADVA
jgi:hypothetical protein